ncbi:MAG: hypothetical protein ACM3KH_00890 [Thiobacillus sp.]
MIILPKTTYDKTARFSFCLILTLILTFLVGLAVTRSVMAGTTGFMAGRIIDDSVFTNYKSMSVAQIQTFLNNKVPTCDTNGTKPSEYGGGTRAQWAANQSLHPGIPAFYPPFTCLKNYKVGGVSSAQIIYNVANKYHINPQVFLVLLQKEQGLVTDDWPGPHQYQKATGYGCPDTAACDSKYYGFTNQVDWAGNMYRSIMDNYPIINWPYRLGNNYIQYNPSTACGGSTVFIQNRATQALYNYTPYQPNKASLDAGWGSAPCGAYGNRNFYLYFTNWFGAATSAATYGFSVVSADAYSDYQYQNKISTPIVVTPGQEFYVKIVLKNTGNQVWYSDIVRLGTQNPADRASLFATSDWINNRRPASVSEGLVMGGNNATFTFKAKAPSELGTYQESFGLVIEGYRWISGSFNVPIIVSSTSAYYSAQNTIFGIYVDKEMTRRIDNSNITLYTGDTIYIKAIIKNTGNRKWPALTTKIGTANPADRVSVYSDASWLSSSRPTAAQADINPSSSGTFTFPLKAPDTPEAKHIEQFGLLIEFQRWISNNIGSVNIQTLQRPPSSLSRSQQIGISGALLSGNGKYLLTLQSDGNLVLYNDIRKPIWATYTMKRGVNKLVMQSDGNLVLYANSGAIWSTRTAGKGESKLQMQNDGNLVIYNKSGATWSTHTAGR